MAACDEDGAADLVLGTEQLALDLGALRKPLAEGGDDQESIGAGQRPDQAGAACGRNGDQAAAHLSHMDSQVLLAAGVGGHLAAEEGFGAGPPRGRNAEHAADGGDHEQLAAEHGRYGIAGEGDHRLSTDGSEGDRLPRADGDAMHEQLAGGANGLGGEVAGAGGGAGERENEVEVATGALDRAAKGLWVIANGRSPRRVGADLGEAGGEHRGVEVGYLAGLDRLPGGDDLAARGDDGDPWGPHDLDLDDACRQERADVGGAKALPGGDDDVGGDDVLADDAGVLPRRGGRDDLENALLRLDHILDHDDGVRLLGKGLAGVDVDRLRPDAELLWRGLRGARGVGGAHGDAVHGGGVVVGRGDGGEDRACGYAAESVLGPDDLGIDGGAQVKALAGIAPDGARLFQGNAAEVYLAAAAALRLRLVGHSNGSTSTSSPA